LDETGNLKAVLLRYYKSYIPYAQGDFDVEGFATLIQQTQTLWFSQYWYMDDVSPEKVGLLDLRSRPTF
jgi:hypothetical protein